MGANGKLQAVFQKIESWDSITIEEILKHADTDSALKKAITERYQPLIEHAEVNGVECLPSLPKEITNEEVLKKQWAPDSKSIEIMGTLPIKDIWLEDIKDFPLWITHLTKLEGLYCRDSILDELPHEISRFRHLKELSVSGGNLKHMPEWICDLPLKELEIRSNELESIPESISNMTELRSLELDYNKLTCLPKSIGKLIHLIKLDLSDNQLSELPPSMSSLANLEDIRMPSNNFKHLPDVISSFSRLETLELGNNPIADVPEWIGSLDKLKGLYLYGTKVRWLPPEIQKLDGIKHFYFEDTPLQKGTGNEGVLDEKEEVQDFLKQFFAGEDNSIIDSIKQLYEDLESREEKRIATALNTLKTSPEMRKRAENRYLGFIQARLNDKDATLSDFVDAALTSDEEKLFFDDTLLGEDFISFHDLDGQACRVIVDFIGGIVRGRLDIDNYFEKAKRTADRHELSNLARDHAKKIKRDNLLQARIYSDGWYGKICAVLAELYLTKVIFDHTRFGSANSSLVLKEFYLFLGSVSHGLTIDVIQSEVPDLSEIFWMLNVPPELNCEDIAVPLPKSPLKFIRHTKIKPNNSSDWEEVESILIKEPEDLKSLLNIAEYHFERENTALAEAYAEKCLALDSRSSEDLKPLLNMAEYYLEQDNMEMALKFADKCLACNSEDPENWFDTGMLLFKLKQFQNAMVCFKNTVELDPENENGWFNIGMCFYNQEKMAESIPYLEKVYELDPEKKNALFFLAYCNKEIHEYEKARRYYLEVVNLYPDYDASWYNLACLEAMQGDPEKAVVYLHKAIALDSKYKSMSDEESDFDGIRDRIDQHKPEDMKGVNSELVKLFEEKLMTPADHVQLEAENLLMKSNDLNALVLEKYKPVLKPLIRDNSKSEIYLGLRTLFEGLFITDPDEAWTIVDFSKSKDPIEELHDDFFEFPLLKNIWTLDLRNNRIKYLSEKIGELKKLTRLCLSLNEMEALPHNVLGIKCLKELVLRANLLSDLPSGITQLENLEFLHLGGNSFAELPDCVYKLSRLKSLYLDNNESLNSISPEIDRLRHLQQLNITNCPIERLPEEFWALKTFTYLDLGGSSISNIPDDIFEYKKLVRLDIRNTKIPDNRKEELKETLDCEVRI